MSGPSLTTVKRLFARSGNRCAFPGCDSPIVEDSGIITGEICHIRAASSGGPRYDPEQSEDERHAAPNLMLLCGRHHKLVDAEPANFTVLKLTDLKLTHEHAGVVEITPLGAKAAASLLAKYAGIVIHSNAGQIAINSPGTIQAGTVNLKTTKAKVTIAAPAGSIAADRAMMSYAKYLIDRYQEFQKADKTKANLFKYIAIHAALKRQFKGDWKLLPISRFAEVVAFLQRRIDNTIVGRTKRARGSDVYHQFEEHG